MSQMFQNALKKSRRWDKEADKGLDAGEFDMFKPFATLRLTLDLRGSRQSDSNRRPADYNNHVKLAEMALRKISSDCLQRLFWMLHALFKPRASRWSDAVTSASSRRAE